MWQNKKDIINFIDLFIKVFYYFLEIALKNYRTLNRLR